MCGRFTLTVDPAELAEQFGGVDFPKQFAPRFNIAPSQPVLAILNDGRKMADFVLWGLIPAWAKAASSSNRIINARGETLAEKPAFRASYKYKRCLIPADGFFEWKSQGSTGTKTPHFIHLKSREPFAFAALWAESSGSENSPIRSCAIITTTPNELMASIHDRMPLILPQPDYAEWIDVAPRSPESLAHLIKPYPAELMQAYPVTTLVNSPDNDRAECILPA